MLHTKKKTDILNGNIPYYKKIAIIIFPYMIFIGPWINISVINLGNIYSFLLIFFVIDNVLKIRYRYISGYIIYFILMIMYAMFTLIWGMYSPIGLGVITSLITSVLVMFYVAGLNKLELKLMLNSMNYFTILVLLLSVIEIITGEYLIFSNIDFIYTLNSYGLHYPGVFFVNPNDLAQYLLVGAPLLIFTNFEKKDKLFSTIIISLIVIFVLVNTLSRMGIISITLVFFAYIFLSEIKNKRNKMLNGLLIMLLIFSLLSYLDIDILKYNIVEQFLKIDTSQGYFTGREQIYSSVLNIAKNNFLFGAGLGASYAISVIGTHNMFLFILTDLGLFWGIGFIIVLILSFLQLLRYKSLRFYDYKINIILISILVVFPLFSSMSSANEQRKIIWILLGIVFSLINNAKITSKYLNISKEERKL